MSIKTFMYKHSQNIKSTAADSVLSSRFDVIEKGIAQLLRKTGQEYFDGLVKYLSEKTNSKYVFVGQYNRKNHTVSTKSFYSDNSHVKDYSYELSETPCDNVLGNELCYHIKGVQSLFPLDDDLKVLNVESYVGLPLFNLSNNTLGIVVIMDTKPIDNIDEIKLILEFFASKTELEIERITLQDELALSHKGFQDVFDSFQDVFFMIHYNNENEPVNFVMSPSVEKTIGYTMAEIKQLDFADFYANPNEREIYIELLKTKKQIKNHPLKLRKKDGSIIHVEIDSEFIDQDLQEDAVFAIRGVIKDVTKQYKENLRVQLAYLIAEKSQRRLTNIKLLSEFIYNTLGKVMEVSNFYIALHDLGKNELYMPVFIDDHQKKNNNEYRITFAKGLTEYIIQSKNVIVKDKKELQELISKEGLSLRGKISEHYVGVPLKSEGICFGVMVMQSYQKDYRFSEEDIELLKFISTQVAYVIERTQWQESLLKQEEHYRSLVENSSEIIGIINGEGVLEYISESINKITGYTTSELIGRNIADFVKIENFSELIKDRISNTLNDDLEIIKILDKKGNKKYLEISLNKNKNKNKNNELIFNAKDITQRVIANKANEFTQKRLNTLHQIEKALLSNRPLSKILKDALKIITDNVFDVDRASVGLFHYEEKKVEILALRTKYKVSKGITAGSFLPFSELTSIATTIKNKPFYISDVSKIAKPKNSDKKNKADGIQSYYIMPIVINEIVIGTFNFGSKTKNYFYNIDKELLDEITQLVAVVINDSTLKTELASRESDLKTIFNSSIEAILKVNNVGEFIVVNERCIELFGYSEKELLTKNFRDITYKEDLLKSNNIFKNFRKEKPKKVVFEKRYQTKKGKVIECKVVVKPIYDANNDIDYLIAFISDKTEEKKALKKVFDLENALNYSAAVFITDLNSYRIIDVNKKLESLSGYNKKELIGESPKLFNSRFHKTDEWEEVWSTIVSGKTWQGEMSYQKKDGTIYWVFETITPIVNAEGTFEQFISIQFDITEDKAEKSNLIREVIEAQEHERERFAMEIHDGLGQVLLAAKMNLSVVNDSSDNMDKESKKILNNSVNLLTGAVQEARNISHGLMSRVLNRFGLAYAVNEIIDDINNTSKLNFLFKHNIKDVRFNEEIEMGIYRTLQELIKNIIKHSKGTKADLKIIKKETELFIEIKDNGVGIAKGVMNNPSSGGIGLRNMRSRIGYLGGEFEIDKKIKKGTKIKINISL